MIKIKSLQSFFYFISLIVLVIPFEMFDGLYFSHLYIVFIASVIFICFLLFKIDLEYSFLIFLSIFAMLLDSRYFIFGGGQENIYSELFKVVLFFIGIYIFVNLINPEDYLKIATIVSFSLILYCSTYILSSANYFTYGGRFQIIDFGSSNTLALILSFCCTITIYKYKNSFGYIRFFYISVFLLGMYLIFITSSRGGMFAVLLSFSIIYIRNLYLFILAICFGGIIIYLFLGDSLYRYISFFDNYSSGRVDIWSYLLEHLAGEIVNLFFGFGSGSVGFIMFNKYIISAHSGFITFLYYYGLIFSITFFYYFVKRFVALINDLSNENIVKLALFSSFSFSFFVDNLFLASQATVYVAFFIGYFFSKDSHSI